MLNVDYKILAKPFAKRLRDILPDKIHPDQRGFVAGRRLSDSVLDVYALIDIILDRGEDFLMCSLDIRKAFNSIDWGFLFYVLNLYGFPKEFLTWFNVIYNDRTARVVNNNEWSDPIAIQKGNFQGCPLSPLFFVLAIEILAIRIRENSEIEGIVFGGVHKKLNLVADDILLLFKNTYSGCNQVEEEILEFSRNSGLSINRDKLHVFKVISLIYD